MRLKMSVEGRPLDEDNLITRARDGDKRSFQELVGIYQGIALRVAYLVVRDRAEAEDVTQDAFVKAYQSLGRFRVGSPFRPWLLRIVRNEGLNRVRSRKRRDQLALRIAAEPTSGGAAPSPESAALAESSRGLLVQALNDLSPKYRAVVVHRYLLDLDERETASLLRLPLGTVKSRTARALAKLEVALWELGDDR